MPAVLAWIPLLKREVRSYAARYRITNTFDREDMFQEGALSISRTAKSYKISHAALPFGLVRTAIEAGLKNWRARSYFRHRHLAYSLPLFDLPGPVFNVDRFVEARQIACQLTHVQVKALLGEGSGSRQARAGARDRALKRLGLKV